MTAVDERPIVVEGTDREPEPADLCHVTCCRDDDLARCGEDVTRHPVVRSWSGKWCEDCLALWGARSCHAHRCPARR